MVTVAEARELLAHAPLTVHGRLPYSSNSALVVVAQDGPTQLVVVYKPLVGERPLWDFPRGTLAHREVAAYDLSQAIGWDLVPLTVWREDGPAGPGMCQLWVEGPEPADFIDIFAADSVPPGWHRIIEGRGDNEESVAVAHSDVSVLREMAVFDAVANNADRKIGHFLVDNGRLMGIDHGVTFNTAPKLRTVLWGFADTPLDPEILESLKRFVRDFDRHGATLATHLDRDEVKMTLSRSTAVLEVGVFPVPPKGGPSVPWPIV